MAHTDIVVKKAVGHEVERLFLSICAGMRNSANAYEREKVSNPTEAVNQIKRAVDMPYRVQKRLEDFALKYGEQYLEECLVLSGGVITYATIKAEVYGMLNYSNELVLLKQTGTWDDIAGLILLQVEDESKKYVVPFPDSYTDIWGE